MRHSTRISAPLMTCPRSGVVRLSLAGAFVREVHFVLIGKRAQTLRAMPVAGKPSYGHIVYVAFHYDSTLPNEASGCADQAPRRVEKRAPRLQTTFSRVDKPAWIPRLRFTHHSAPSRSSQ